MKRLSETQRIRNVRHSKREQRREFRRKRKEWQRERGVGSYEEVLLDVPEEFNLGDNVNDSLDFFGRLRQSILVDRKLGKIDFRSCNSISAGAGFILAAEVDRCRQLRYRDGRPALTGTYPDDAGMGRFLDDLGFFRFLKIRSPVYRSDSSSRTKFIAMRSGCRDKGKEIHYVTEVLGTGSVRLDEEARDTLYEGLLEAMNNVTSHAYPLEDRSASLPVLQGRWWAAGYWDNLRKEVGVLIYDQGVGIPATLPNSRHGTLLTEIRRRLGLGNSDPECIRAAMEIGTSSSRSEHRGRGMASLRHAVGRVTDGHLLILSGAGVYLHTADGREETSALRTSLGGTFIEWRIRDENLITWGDG